MSPNFYKYWLPISLAAHLLLIALLNLIRLYSPAPSPLLLTRIVMIENKPVPPAHKPAPLPATPALTAHRPLKPDAAVHIHKPAAPAPLRVTKPVMKPTPVPAPTPQPAPGAPKMSQAVHPGTTPGPSRPAHTPAPIAMPTLPTPTLPTETLVAGQPRHNWTPSTPSAMPSIAKLSPGASPGAGPGGRGPLGSVTAAQPGTAATPRAAGGAMPTATGGLPTGPDLAGLPGAMGGTATARSTWQEAAGSGGRGIAGLGKLSPGAGAGQGGQGGTGAGISTTAMLPGAGNGPGYRGNSQAGLPTGAYTAGHETGGVPGMGAGILTSARGSWEVPNSATGGGGRIGTVKAAPGGSGGTGSGVGGAMQMASIATPGLRGGPGRGGTGAGTGGLPIGVGAGVGRDAGGIPAAVGSASGRGWGLGAGTAGSGNGFTHTPTHAMPGAGMAGSGSGGRAVQVASTATPGGGSSLGRSAGTGGAPIAMAVGHDVRVLPGGGLPGGTGGAGRGTHGAWGASGPVGSGTTGSSKAMPGAHASPGGTGTGPILVASTARPGEGGGMGRGNNGTGAAAGPTAGSGAGGRDMPVLSPLAGAGPERSTGNWTGKPGEQSNGGTPGGLDIGAGRVTYTAAIIGGPVPFAPSLVDEEGLLEKEKDHQCILIVEVLVGPGGKPIQATLLKRCNYNVINNNAIRIARSRKFRPGMEQGVAHQSTVRLRIRYVAGRSPEVTQL